MNPEELADRLAIQELIHSYNHAIDRRDEALFESLWIEEAICGAMEGRETIVGALRSTGSKFADLNHLTTNLVVELSGDEARARSKSIVSRRLDGADAAEPMVVVEYSDELIRKGSEWKFRNRSFRSAPLERT